MTTFSQQEVEFLQNHGNEVGRRTWLCIFDPKTDGCSDMKDSQKFKEFLQDKYEKKKWHFSKCKNRRDVEGPWSPGVPSMPPSHGPLPGQGPTHNTRAPRPLSQAQLPSWDRGPAISPADMRTDVFTARPLRSQSFRDPPLKDAALCGIERQRPGSLSSALGSQSHAPSFPALPRPSASSSFKNHFTLGRTVSVSGTTGPFRAFPKSLSVDFGGLSHSQTQPLPQSLSQPQQQQQSGSGGQTTPPISTAKNQDKYAAVSHLDSVFSDPPAPTQPGMHRSTFIHFLYPPAGGPPQYSSLFGNRLSSSSTPASSPGVDTVSGSQTFTSDSGAFVTSPTSVFPPPVSFPAPGSHNAFHETDGSQETNGFASFSVSDSQPKVPRSMSVNPFTGNVYPSRGTSKNPFI
ncbi:hypothetical protein WMY93_014495 [Mugilogobius chulae]|uniref:Arf-GAP domain-containing protein n=1 Tax=Mugilogobius chulae TaxID=88201 RepID=A0AAW0NUM8_9GOBI